MTMPDTALHFLTIAEAAGLIASRKLSPVELVEAFLKRIEAVDGLIRSYITLCPDQALASARQAEAEIMAGRYRGPLHGIPYGLKDNFMVRGMRTTANSRLMLDHVPEEDATAHLRLQDAGAILLGKLNTYEYGTGNGDNLFELPFAPARNPWNLDCFSGGSTTGGGVSVSAGTAMLALGTDTGGSVRLPAAACGASGLKPTYGLVSRAGILPNCYSLDSVGPITWSAGDTGLALAAIAGFDPRDPASARTGLTAAPDYRSGLKGLRVGVLRRFHEQDIATEQELVTAFDNTVGVLATLGAEIVELDFPFSLLDFRNCSRLINSAESYSIHETDFRDRGDQMGVALRDKLSAGRAISAVDYLRAQRWRRQLAAEIDGLFGTCDVVLCCGATRRPARFDDRAGVAAFTTESAMAAFSISGHPAISICSGFSQDGLPLNLQIAGRRFEDGHAVVVAAALDGALGLKPRRPDLDSAKPPVLPAWAASPPPKPGPDAQVRAAAQASIDATVAKLPAELTKDLEPFVTVDTGNLNASQ